jgi:hypothetical protein
LEIVVAETLAGFVKDDELTRRYHGHPIMSGVLLFPEGADYWHFLLPICLIYTDFRMSFRSWWLIAARQAPTGRESPASHRHEAQLYQGSGVIAPEP